MALYEVKTIDWLSQWPCKHLKGNAYRRELMRKCRKRLWKGPPLENETAKAEAVLLHKAMVRITNREEHVCSGLNDKHPELHVYTR